MVAHQAPRHFPGDKPRERMVSPQQSPPKQSVGSSLEDALEEALFLFLFPLLWYRILWSLSWGLLFLMKNTSRKSVQDRFNLMWKRISNAHCVPRKLWSALAFKYPDLKMPQCFEGKEEENFFVFVFLISFREKIKKKKEEPSFPQGKDSSDEHNYNLGGWAAPGHALKPGVRIFLLETVRKSPACIGRAHLLPGRPSPVALPSSGHILWAENQGLPNAPSLAFLNPAPTCARNKPCPAPSLSKPVSRNHFTQPMARLSFYPSIAGDKIPNFSSKNRLTNSVSEFQNPI